MSETRIVQDRVVSLDRSKVKELRPHQNEPIPDLGVIIEKGQFPLKDKVVDFPGATKTLDPTTPSIGLSQERIDLLYIDESGIPQVHVGAPGTPPVTIPEHIGKAMPIAEVTLTAGQTQILDFDMLRPSEQDTPNNTVKVKRGTYAKSDASASVTVKAGVADSLIFPPVITYPRIDLLALDDSGNAIREAGVESVSPIPPSYPTDKLVIAEVTIDETDVVVINDADIKDVRSFIKDVRTMFEKTSRVTELEYFTDDIVDAIRLGKNPSASNQFMTREDLKGRLGLLNLTDLGTTQPTYGNTLAVVLHPDSTQIVLYDASKFPNSGEVTVDPGGVYEESITYTGKSVDSLTGISKPVYTHPVDTTVRLNITTNIEDGILHGVNPAAGNPFVTGSDLNTRVALLDISHLKNITSSPDGGIEAAIVNPSPLRQFATPSEDPPRKSPTAGNPFITFDDFLTKIGGEKGNIQMLSGLYYHGQTVPLPPNAIPPLAPDFTRVNTNDVTPSDLSIEVENVAGWPAEGVFTIGGEFIKYENTETDPPSFTGLTRGYLGSGQLFVSPGTDGDWNNTHYFGGDNITHTIKRHKIGDHVIPGIVVFKGMMEVATMYDMKLYAFVNAARVVQAMIRPLGEAVAYSHFASVLVISIQFTKWG